MCSRFSPFLSGYLGPPLTPHPLPRLLFQRGDPRGGDVRCAPGPGHPVRPGRRPAATGAAAQETL